MKSRPAPTPINYRRPLPTGLSSDPQVRKWVYRLKAGKKLGDRRPTEAELAWVYREVMRDRPEFSQQQGDLYLKAMADTCPVIAAPELDRTDVAGDMEQMLFQPEMRAFWDSWDGTRGGSGPSPDFFGAKAVMATMGMAGIGAHIDENYAELINNQKLTQVFRRLEGRSDANPPSYKHVCKQLPKVANQSLIMATNVRMVQALAELMPGRGIGERLILDGTDVPAWCEQKGVGKTKQQEAYRRRNCPHAGARAVKRGSKGKSNVGDKDSATSFMIGGDFWRGYYLVAIADQATGLPLVWIVQDASIDEAAAIVPLLSRLYRLWPEIPAKVIAGDSAWDEKEWCRLTEQDYGIHPIFRWHDERGEEIAVDGFSRKENVLARTNKGQLICAKHRNLLEFAGAETPSRRDLYIGKTHPRKGEFRVRGFCKDGCGRMTMRMLADWRRLTYYPHFSVGGSAPERVAYRDAMLTRLNGIEGIWERLEVGRHLGTQGGDRTRVKDLGSHETIVSLALLSMTASALADQRRQKGIRVTPNRPIAATSTGALISAMNGGRIPPPSPSMPAASAASTAPAAAGAATGSESEGASATAVLDRPHDGDAYEDDDAVGIADLRPDVVLSVPTGASPSPFDDLLDEDDAILGV